jgi:nucleoside-diphosphate-sugar epimerase
MKKVLVTGGAGYIGSVLVGQLLERGYYVKVLDILNFGGESLIYYFNKPNFEFIKGDIRNKEDIINALKDINAVIHLAAIVGDPACAKQPELAKQINWYSSKQLFDYCNNNTEVERFIFASTCSNYGKMLDADYVDENSPLNPVSLYAELKVKFEKYILESSTRENFSPTSLRFSTVYGLSPRMRFDLTVNEFMKDATLGRELVVYGEQFWRPYCHVNDLARACIIALEAKEELIDHEVYNVGDTHQNYQKKMIIEEIKKILPELKVRYVEQIEDPRDYRVNFNKIKSKLGFNITKTILDGLKEIFEIIRKGIISDPDSKKYKNI